MQSDKVLNDDYWMKKAISLAKKAESQGEVPVGALLVLNDQIVATAINKKEQWKTPIGHAEVICLHRASQKLDRWRLSDCTLYVTLEPCIMCAGAIIQARIGRVVYGTTDPKAGAVESIYSILSDIRLNHRPNFESGILKEDCSSQLTEFFKKRRNEKKSYT